MTAMNRAVLFSNIRAEFYPGRFPQAAVDGINAILAAADAYPGGVSDKQLAYILATAYHETAHTFRPLREYGRGKGRPYGRPAGPYGKRYYGRGFVQLTWLRNYKKAGQAVGVDLVRHPDRAMRPDIAAKILVWGMMKGWFHAKGYGLARYLGERRSDWKNARRTVNGTDRASLIAGYARRFHAIIAKAQAVPETEATDDLARSQPTGKPMHRSTTAWGAIITAVAGVTAAVKQIAGDVIETGAAFGLTPGAIGWGALGAASIVGAVWIIRERKLKAYLEGV